MTGATAKRVAARLLLVAGGLVLATIVAELGLRATGAVVPRPRSFPGERTSRENPHFVADAALGWVMRPSIRFTWTTEGRDVEYAADARGRRVVTTASGDRTIIVAGDSFAWGTGVTADETFAARLAALVPGSAILDVAQPGYGVDQITRAARGALDELPDGRPAAVIAAIYPEDLERSRTAFRLKEGMSKPLFAVRDGRLVDWTPRDRPGAIRLWLERESFVFAAFDRLAERLALRFPFGDRWEVNGRAIEDLAAACARRGAPLLLVHVPTRNRDPFPALSRFADARGIDCLDPLDLADPMPADAWFPIDLHLSAAGHAALAERIAARLRPALEKSRPRVR